jgi:hypothetical protein
MRVSPEGLGAANDRIDRDSKLLYNLESRQDSSLPTPTTLPGGFTLVELYQSAPIGGARNFFNSQLVDPVQGYPMDQVFNVDRRGNLNTGLSTRPAIGPYDV